MVCQCMNWILHWGSCSNKLEKDGCFVCALHLQRCWQQQISIGFWGKKMHSHRKTSLVDYCHVFFVVFCHSCINHSIRFSICFLDWLFLPCYNLKQVVYFIEKVIQAEIFFKAPERPNIILKYQCALQCAIYPIPM